MKWKFFLFVFSALKTFSQPLVSDGNNKQILSWDTGFKIETIRYYASKFDYPTDYQYIVRKDSKIVGEYFRHDDSSFLFVRFDAFNQPVERGILKICDEIFKHDTIRLPDWLKDPFGEKGIGKDTIVATISYRKFGRWKEADSSGKVWIGNYINGKKEGIWELGYTRYYDNHMPAEVVEIQYDNFRPLSKHIFENGNEISRFKDATFWPVIKGKWVHKEFIDSNTIVFQRGSYPRPQFSFDTDTTFSSYRKPMNATVSDALEKYSTDWKQEGDLIEIIEGGKRKLIQVLSISGNQLIVRFLKW